MTGAVPGPPAGSAGSQSSRPAGGEDSADPVREAELVRALAAVRTRVAEACDAASRDPRSVTLIAVTKTYPARDVATLVRLGVGDVGENRDQEASAKVAETARLLAALGGDAPPVRWHFVGQLQRRKARSVATYAAAVHSVDRPELVDALSDAVARAGRDDLDVFVQVGLDDTPGRGGVAPDALDALADRVAEQPGLRLRGLMAVAPLPQPGEASDADAAFARLAELSQRLRARHPGADAVSAGMSGDLEQAIAHGATHLRIGTALLGRRAPQIG